MRHKTVILFLAATAAICIAFHAASISAGAIFTAAAAFPFEQIGLMLRAMSLSGGAGNAAAIVLYAVICLLPAAYLVCRWVMRRARIEDTLLAVLSAVLLAVLYLMVNPAYIGLRFGGGEMAGFAKSLLGVAVYSVLAGYVVLRVLRLFTLSSSANLLHYLYILLAAAGAVCVFGIFGSGIGNVIDALRQFNLSNTDGYAQTVNLSHVFIVLQYLASDAIPLGAQVFVVYSGLSLVNALELEPYGSVTVNAAVRLGNVCRMSILAVMLSQIAVNLLQLIFSPAIRAIHYSINLPIGSIVFVLAALLLAKYFERGKELQEENDAFI